MTFVHRTTLLLLSVPALLLAMACSGSPKRAAAPTINSTGVSLTASPASSAVAGSHTPAALPIGSPAAPTPSSATPDALQERLAGALLGEGNLPAGFAQSRLPTHSNLISGADATAVAVFTRAAGGAPGTEQIVSTLFAFRDAISAANGLGQAQSALTAVTSLPGSTLAVAPVPSDTAIGDGTQTFRIAGALAGVGSSGFAVYWRHGNVVAGVAEFGVDANLLPPAVDALARTQEARLAAAGF
jgi:hypothetical protein